MIITGGNVCYQGPQDIERCAFAERLLDFHVCGNLIKRHMARAFYNDLDILVPCLLGKLTQGNQLLDLGNIGSVRDTSGPAGVAQTEGYIIFLANLQDLVEMFKERVFKTGHFHPGEDDGTAS